MSAYKQFPKAVGIGLMVLLTACGGPGTEGDGQQVDTLAQATNDQAQVIGVGGKLFSIPSPVQTALAIRKAGLKYQKDLAIPLDKGETLTTKAAQSLALGMYGADLAYVTVHRDGARAIATMQVIEKLGSAIGVSNAFDRTLIERFKTNMNNEDSLLRFSGTAFRAADQYLKENQSEDISALVLAGGWIESLYLTISDAAALKDQAMVDRIGEQKTTLNALVDLLAATEKDGNAAALLTSLKELQAEFAAVNSTYTFEKPVTDAAAKTTYINSKSTVTIAADKVASITAKVAALRNMILA